MGPNSSSEELSLLANALKYSGSRDFGYVDQLVEAVELCCQMAGNLLEKELKECKARFDNLDKTLGKCRIGRNYEDKKSAYRSYMDKDKNRFARDKPKPAPTQQRGNPEKVFVIDSDDDDAKKPVTTITNPLHVGQLKTVRPIARNKPAIQ